MSEIKQKLMIIDGNALIHRSFHALPDTIKTKKGVITNAVYGFTSFLIKSIRELKPKYVVLTLDEKAPTFRHKKFKEYKAKRVKAPDELYAQIPLVRKVATAFNIPIFSKSGFEADDLIGTIAKKTEKNIENIIVTGDMDTLQLINEKTKVYTMSRGVSDSVIYNDLLVKQKIGVKPSQVIDYKALRGDPSDNIPGVQGVGEKTAVELLNEFKTLNNLYKNIDQNTKQITEKLIVFLSIKIFPPFNDYFIVTKSQLLNYIFILHLLLSWIITSCYMYLLNLPIHNFIHKNYRYKYILFLIIFI